MTTNGSDNGGIASLYREAKRMVASPQLYVGAVTVVLANEVVEWLDLTDAAAMGTVFLATLVLLYGQLMAVAWARRRGYGRAC